MNKNKNLNKILFIESVHGLYGVIYWFLYGVIWIRIAWVVASVACIRVRKNTSFHILFLFYFF